MTPPDANLVLIGMPGAGKSTVGVILAKKTARDFVDTDVLMQTAQRRTLQDILDRDGYAAFLRVEEEVILGLQLQSHVIATGGSVVYSERAMERLKAGGLLIFLDVALATLEARVDDVATRGLARRPGQSLAELYAERRSLYTGYADLTVTGDGLTQEQVCDRIIAATAVNG
jgi:shikimate kinase